MVIYKVFSYSRPVSVINMVSKVVSLPYFRKHKLFNSCVQSLICSPGVLQTATHLKEYIKELLCWGGGIFPTRWQHSACAKHNS